MGLEPHVDDYIVVRFLKELKKLTKDKGLTSIEPTLVEPSRWEKHVNAEITFFLKQNGFITEYALIPGHIQITASGIEKIKNENKLFKAYAQFRALIQKLPKLISEYGRVIFYGVLLYTTYLIIESFIVIQLNKIWVDPFISIFQPNYFFDVLFISLSAVLIYKNKNNAIKTWDVFLICIYLRYSFFNDSWKFWTMFDGASSIKMRYIDIIPIYYLAIISATLYYIIVSRRTKEYTDGFLIPDLSIDKLSLKSKQTIYDLDLAGLNRTRFANQIADIIRHIIPFQAFAIGICGPWGSGKTSFIALIITRLKAITGAKQYIYIEFSPWYFSNSEMLITSFFSILEKKFESNKSLSRQLKAYSKEITMVEKTILKTEFSKLLFDENIGLKERYNAIITEIKKENKTIVISIDDLDRLDKKEIVEVFRLIRLIADFPNTFYLVAYDRGYINSAIEQELTKHNPDKYLDKIINVEFKIPEVATDIVRQRLQKTLETQITNLGKEIVNIDITELDMCFTTPVLDKFIRNERDIKRFTNNIIMRYISIKEEVNFYHFFLLELLYYKSLKCYSEIYENRDVFFKEYQTVMERSDAQFNFGLLTTNTESEVLQILNELFKKGNHTARFGIANKLYFYRYFALNLLANDFSDVAFDSSFNLPVDNLIIKLIEFNSINSELLAIKLYNKFNNESVENENLSNIVDALLFLYNTLYHSKDEATLLNGVNTNNLGNLLFHILHTMKRPIDYLIDKIINKEIKYFDAYSQLLSFSNAIRIYPNDIDILLKFRSTQLQFLQTEVTRSQENKTFYKIIVRQLQNLHTFIPVNDKNTPDVNYLNWYFENVIERNRSFIANNINHIISYMSKASPTYEGRINPTEMIKSVFHDITMDTYRTIEFESLRDFYFQRNKYEYKYTFINKIPVNDSYLQHNDDIFKHCFHINHGNEYHITFSPLNTNYWRLGFRFSVDKNFPLIESERHIDKNPILHLGFGSYNETNGNINDSNGRKNVTLSFYNGKDFNSETVVIEDYDLLPITISIFKNTITPILEVNHKKINAGKLELANYFNNFQYMEILAWADGKDFKLESSIKILAQETDIILR